MKNKNAIRNTLLCNRGFVALTLVITIASLLLAFSYTQFIDTGHFFDQVRVKSYRTMNYYNAYSCIDQAILRLAQDYFYIVSSSIKISDLNCSIDSVRSEDGLRIIETQGNYKNVIVKRKAKIKMYDSRLEIISIE